MDGRSDQDLTVIKTSSYFYVTLVNWNTEATHSLTFICTATGEDSLLEIIPKLSLSNKFSQTEFVDLRILTTDATLARQANKR